MSITTKDVITYLLIVSSGLFVMLLFFFPSTVLFIWSMSFLYYMTFAAYWFRSQFTKLISAGEYNIISRVSKHCFWTIL